MFSGPKVTVCAVMATVIFMALSVVAHSESKTGISSDSSPLSLEQIVARIEQSRLRTKQTPPFQMTREYQMFHADESKPTSQVKAQINVVPPTDREYRIVESQGNDRGEKVVRKILDHEAQAEKTKPSPTAVTSDNYDFALQGRQIFEGVNCYVLDLKPKREEPSLIAGRAWVDPNTFAIRKIEGKVAKSPSWWVKDVNLVINFGEIGGIWMQTSSQAVADVRVVGKYTLRGRALDVQTAGTLAANMPQKKMLRHRNDLPAAFLYGSAVARR